MARWFIAALMAVLLALSISAQADASSGRLLATNCSPAASQGDRLFFNQRKADGLFEPRVGNLDCSASTPLLPPYDGHRGVGDVAGNLVLFETATGVDRKASYAEPGKGFGVQLQLLDRSTGVLKQLTTGRKGIIWGKLRADGGAVAWSEMLKTRYDVGSFFGWDPYFLGQWELHVADIQNGVLVNERKWSDTTDPGFLEAYGWVPGTNRIIFASDQGVRKPSQALDWFQAQLWTIPDTLTGGPTRVSPKFGTENSYHEFAHIRDGWVYTSIARDTTGTGMDLWRMRLDGTGRERVSWFGGKPRWDWASFSTKYDQVAGFPLPRYIVVGGLAWNGKGWTAGVARDKNSVSIDAYEIIP